MLRPQRYPGARIQMRPRRESQVRAPRSTCRRCKLELSLRLKFSELVFEQGRAWKELKPCSAEAHPIGRPSLWCPSPTRACERGARIPTGRSQFKTHNADGGFGRISDELAEASHRTSVLQGNDLRTPAADSAAAREVDCQSDRCACRGVWIVRPQRTENAPVSHVPRWTPPSRGPPPRFQGTQSVRRCRPATCSSSAPRTRPRDCCARPTTMLSKNASSSPPADTKIHRAAVSSARETEALLLQIALTQTSF